MKFTETSFEPYELYLPTVSGIPLVCDSPHSGAIYPADFQSCLPVSKLQSGEDSWVDQLWRAIPSVGASLLVANFPRSYIDPNRALTDINPAMLAEPWPHGELHPSVKSSVGAGLLWERVNGLPMYDRKLWVAEVENRIATYYQPYHAALKNLADQAHQQFGCVWHLNLHSMPSDSYTVFNLGAPHPLADFVLGDRDGSTCDPTLIGVIQDFLQERGYSVACNNPFKGQTLVQLMGKPDDKRYSLQIEINRKLYMDEASYEKNEGFDSLQATLSELSIKIAGFMRQQL